MTKMAPVNVRLNPVGVVVCVVLLICVALYIFGFPKWFSQEEERVSMKALLSVSIELARRGGFKVKEIAESHKLNAVSKGKTKEGAEEIKTEGDMQSHRAMVYGFAKAYPGMKVISEEHDTTPIDLKVVPGVDKDLTEVSKAIESDQSIPINQITVWIDPLDATQEYKDELYQYVTTMVCVAVKGQPVIGVIYKPFTQETVWAWVGYGHSANLKKAEKKINEKNKKIIVSRSHSGPVKEVAEKAFGADVEIIIAGGAGYKTLEVIKGAAHAYVHVTAIKKWDICAGNAILSAVDGKMTTLKGDYIEYSPKGSVVNSEGLLSTVYDHNNFLESLESFTKDKVKT